MVLSGSPLAITGSLGLCCSCRAESGLYFGLANPLRLRRFLNRVEQGQLFSSWRFRLRLLGNFCRGLLYLDRLGCQHLICATDFIRRRRLRHCCDQCYFDRRLSVDHAMLSRLKIGSSLPPEDDGSGRPSRDPSACSRWSRWRSERIMTRK
jgi:hypothetical protein